MCTHIKCWPGHSKMHIVISHPTAVRTIKWHTWKGILQQCVRIKDFKNTHFIIRLFYIFPQKGIKKCVLWFMFKDYKLLIKFWKQLEQLQFTVFYQTQVRHHWCPILYNAKIEKLWTYTLACYQLKNYSCFRDV